VEGTVDIAFIGCNRVFYGARHRTERCLMENIVNCLTRRLTNIRIADIALYEGKARPLLVADQISYFGKVFRIAGSKVVKPDDELVKFQEVFKQIGTDK